MFIRKGEVMTFSMELRNDSCVQNITDASVQQGALTVGLTGISCFILNLVGLTAELIFVCKRKNTFLLRLFVYLSVAVTMVIGCYSLFILMQKKGLLKRKPCKHFVHSCPWLYTREFPVVHLCMHVVIVL